MSNKLYVLVRGDLSRSQQAVQASHAVAEFMLYDNNVSCSCGQCRDKYWENNTIVLLKLRDQDDLNRWNQFVAEHRYPSSVFYEPDIDQHTALATYDIDGKLQEYLKHIPLV